MPVINALSDEGHPCQALADLLTVLEALRLAARVRLAFVRRQVQRRGVAGGGCALTGVSFAMASPVGYSLPEQTRRTVAELSERERRQRRLLQTPADAVRGAEVVYTDVRASMGQEDSYAARKGGVRWVRVTVDLMALTKPGAIFMHDLPAHRGEEVMEDVIEGPQSVVFDQAENRLHAQKAILA